MRIDPEMNRCDVDVLQNDPQRFLARRQSEGGCRRRTGKAQGETRSAASKILQRLLIGPFRIRVIDDLDDLPRSRAAAGQREQIPAAFIDWLDDDAVARARSQRSEIAAGQSLFNHPPPTLQRWRRGGVEHASGTGHEDLEPIL
jgi:hypothetical protein